MTEGKRNIIQQLLQEYDIETAEEIQDVLKDLLGRTIKEMMEAEMDHHFGYQKSERSDHDDYRNGYKSKKSVSVMEVWKQMCHKIETLHLSYKQLKKDKKISQIQIKKSFPCMQKE